MLFRIHFHRGIIKKILMDFQQGILRQHLFFRVLVLLEFFFRFKSYFRLIYIYIYTHTYLKGFIIFRTCLISEKNWECE